MKIFVTQYGYPHDECGDSLTEAGWGAWDNKLTDASCALNKLAQNALGLTSKNHGAKLQIDFGNGVVLVRFWDDIAPETDKPRLDLYQPSGFNKSYPDYGNVTVLEDKGSTPALKV
jgi:hypothetical protein